MDVILNIKGFIHKIKKSNSIFNLSEEILFNKIKLIPDWQNKLIEREFIFFNYFKNKKDSFGQNSIKNAIEKTISNLENANLLKTAELIKIEIKNNKIFITNYLENTFHPRFIRFQNFLNTISKIVTFPDITFLYSIADFLEDQKLLQLIEAPIFCISKKIANNKIVLFPHVEWMSKNDSLIGFLCKADLHCPWENKINKAFWRGSNTGNIFLEKNERYKIIRFSNQYPEIFDVYFSEVLKNGLVNDANVEIDFFKNSVEAKYVSNKICHPSEQIKYKFLLAIDGNAFPGSFYWQLFSNSLVLKNKSSFLEWYYAGIENDKHYVEYENENDLLYKINYLKHNDSHAKQIVTNANMFSASFLKNEGLVSYINLLFNKYFNEFFKR